MKYSTSPTPSVSRSYASVAEGYSSRGTSPLPPPINHQRDCLSATTKSYKYLRRLLKFNQMDFEFALWQIINLFIAPQKVYRNFNYRKQTKSQFARDDPAFLILLVICLCVTSLGFAYVLDLSRWQSVTLILYVVFVDCIFAGIVVATFYWLVTNGYLRSSNLEPDIEWGYAFDVHLNAFFPPLMLLHFVQLFFYNWLIRTPWFFSCFIGNTFWLLACCYYVYITFLGYNCIPHLKNTRLLLIPLPLVDCSSCGRRFSRNRTLLCAFKSTNQVNYAATVRNSINFVCRSYKTMRQQVIGVLIALVAVCSAVKVPLTVYYESLCPDSAALITQQIQPALRDELKDYVDITWVPFGKSEYETRGSEVEFTCHHGPNECYGNKVHACAIEHIQANSYQTEFTRESLTLNFINCLMMAGKNWPDNKYPGARCARENNVNTWENIEQCANSTEGSQLLKRQGEVTYAFQRPLTSVPTVVFRHQYDADTQQQALKNFRSTLCKYIPEPKPKTCSAYNSAVSVTFAPLLGACLFALSRFF